MQLEEGLDTGPVYDTVRVPIGPRTTAEELRTELVRVGTAQLVRVLDAPLGVPEPQSGEATYAAKLQSAELRIDWSQPAEMIDRLVRLGGAWTTFRGRRVKVLRADVAEAPEGTLPPTPGLMLLTVQPEGKAPMPFADFVRGVRPLDGESFE
jgi:methionyl-tRNA formyltransferase